jgi:hypothetical protein
MRLLDRSDNWLRVLTCCAVLAGLSALPCSPAVELVLKDGQVLKGVDVRRNGDLYELQSEGGQVIPIPSALVEEVRLSGEKEEKKPELAPGFVADGPQQLAGDPAKGLVASDPEVLAGQKVTPPRTSEQLNALGEPSKFQKGVVDPEWRPSSDWDMSAENNNFAPSKWQDSIIDESWQPSSDYTADTDVTDFNPTEFKKDIIDPSWQPQDGFKKNNNSSTWPNSAIPSNETFEFAGGAPSHRRAESPVRAV